MARNERLARLFGVVLWLTIVLGAQWAVGQRQEGERVSRYRDYRAQVRLYGRTPAMRQAYRDVADGSERAFVFTLAAMTVASGVGAAAIVFVPLRRRPLTPTNATLA